MRKLLESGFVWLGVLFHFALSFLFRRCVVCILSVALYEVQKMQGSEEFVFLILGEKHACVSDDGKNNVKCPPRCKRKITCVLRAA